MHLTEKQTQALDMLEHNRIIVELLYGGSAGGGKSALGCYWITKMCLKFPEVKYLLGRSVLKTLKETTLQTLLELFKKQGLKVNVHYKLNGQSNTIEFFNGSQILMKDLFQYPSDPEFDELGSLEITGAFVDEANQITDKARSIVRSRIRFKLDDYGITPKILYTCNPAKNWVYTDFYKPQRDGDIIKDRMFIRAFVTDNPHISKHYINNLHALSTKDKERLLYGNFEYDDDPATLIDYDSIIDCFTNQVLAGTKYITCDYARFGNDSTVIGLWNGYSVKLYQYKGLSVPEAAEKIKALQRDNNIPASRTIIDEDGVGGGLVDVLKCRGFVNNSRPLNGENFDNLKSQCYFKLADVINAALMRIETDNRDEVIAELEQVKQKSVDTDGRKGVVPKDRVKEILRRSPDFSDCLMMRMWFDLAKTKGAVSIGGFHA